MSKTIIHVNQHKIKSNKKNKICEPVLTIKNRGSNQYTNMVEFENATGKVVYQPDKPLSCGATAWIEFSDGTIRVV